MSASKCKYMLAWSGPCCADAEVGLRCARHSGIECANCGAPADRECSHTGQFVCGAPLCDQCEGFVDSTQPSGSWGFLNHSHRRKATTTPVSVPSLSRRT